MREGEVGIGDAEATDLVKRTAPARKMTREEQRSVDLAECGAKLDALLTEYGVAFAVTQRMTLGPNGGPVYAYDVAIVSK